MKQLIFLMFFVSAIILGAEDQTDPGQMVEITTSDDVEYLDVIIAENDTTVTLKAQSGIIVRIPTHNNITIDLLT